MDTELQDDLLIIAALARFSYQFEDAKTELAAWAWDLAVALADEQGIEPLEALYQVKYYGRGGPWLRRGF
jgi:hypothetical protein